MSINALSSAPPFGERTIRKCKVCGSEAWGFDSVDSYRICNEGGDPHQYGMSGVPVPYFRCQACDFLFTDFCDDWTADDFARLIYNADYVKADPEYTGSRARRSAVDMAKLFAGREGARILDYGSGSGVFADAMRERGFNVATFDPFSSAQRPAGLFDIVTAFEVVEHTPNPIDTFGEMLGFLRPGGTLLFSQCVQPADIHRVRGAWWYLGPRNGHVSTYSERTLARIAADFGRTLRNSFDLFTMQTATTAPLREEFVTVSDIRLLAGDGPDWHDLEQGRDGPFRWTAQRIINWHAELAGRNHITLPFVDEIAPGFAARSKLTVNGDDVPMEARGHQLGATIDANGPADITLTQDELVCPASRGVADERHLGIAVRAH